MVTFFIETIVDWLDSAKIFTSIQNNLTFYTSLFQLLNDNFSGISSALQVVYFFAGKSFVIGLMAAIYVVFAFRLVMAIVNLIGQFVP